MKSFCMFVKQDYQREISKLFFYNKEVAQGINLRGNSLNRKAVVYSLSSLATLKATSAYTKLFYMQEERNFVTGNAERVTVTPAQKNLLELLNHLNAGDYSHFLKEIHDLGTYYPHKDLVNLQASLHVNTLQQAVAAIAAENPQKP